MSKKSKILECALNIIDCHVYWKNRRGKYLWCNKKLADVLGLRNQNEIEKKTDYDLYNKDLAKVVVELDSKVLSTGKEYQTEEVGLDLMGKKAVYLSIKKPIRDKAGIVEGLIGMSIDITEKKQAELAKQEFVQNIAHDLRTPLVGIMGLASLQASDAPHALEREYGQMIYGASEQLLELLNSVIEVTAAKHINKFNKLKKDKINLKEFVKELQVLIEPTLHKKALQFDLQLDPKLPKIIISDRIKLKRILLNLLANAIKFTKHGNINVTINLLSINNNHAQLEIKISDTGIGIPNNQFEKIFKRFYRINPSYEGIYKGSGVGLYLVKKLLRSLKGKITVSSQEGIGTCFTLLFNFSIANKVLNNVSNTVMPKSVEQNNSSSQKNILVVEDNTLVLHAVKKKLENLGYQVITATDGNVALDYLQTQSFTWVLLDIGLPGLNGNEVAKRYRKWESERKKSPLLPLFALTAHYETAHKEVGINHIFFKPFTDKHILFIEKFIKGQY
ncbi:MAG: ATP-binding protein [Rickettsiella sp.]|nr:ATP-binding protein [Rickettsiella sp.]